MHNQYQSINKTFENAVISLQDNLQYLADHDIVSNKFIQRQNRILKALIDYQRFTEEHIHYLEKQNSEVRIARRENTQKLHDHIISFEAICIIHGIMDFPMWLSFGKNHLINKATFLNNAGKMQLSDLFIEKLNYLRKDEKDTILKILNKKNDTQLKLLLKRINNNHKYRLTYGTRAPRHKEKG